MADTDKVWQSTQAVTENVTYATMMADFKGRGAHGRFLQLLAKAQSIRWGFCHHLYTSTYYRDCVALVGDSANASLPFQAAVAGQGLGDALVLLNMLAIIVSAPERDAALEPYVRATFEGYDFGISIDGNG